MTVGTSSSATTAAIATTALLAFGPKPVSGFVPPMAATKPTTRAACAEASAVIRKSARFSQVIASRHGQVRGALAGRDDARPRSTLRSVYREADIPRRAGWRRTHEGSRYDAAGRRRSLGTCLEASLDNRDASGDGNGGGSSRRPNMDESAWRRIGDVPSLLVGVGFLVARQRREMRASNERRHADDPKVEEQAAVASRMAAAAGVAASSGARSAGAEVRRGSSRPARDGRGKGVPQASRGSSSNRGGFGWDARSREEVWDGEREVGEEGEDEEEVEQAGGWNEADHLAEEQQRQYVRDVDKVLARRGAPEQSAPSRTSSILDVSLDRTVLPEPVGPVVGWGTNVMVLLVAIAVAARIPRMVGAVGQLSSVVGGLRYNSRLWAGSLRAWASRRRESWERTFGPEEELLPADDWTVCTLLERRPLGGNVVRYRFGLQGSPNAVLPLELGQELTLCGLDSSNKVVHGNYVPLTPKKQRGFFDVVGRSSSAQMDDGLGTTRSDREFARFLDTLPAGDEIAVKPGREGLVYDGPYAPITDLVLVATGLGVVPMIQMVNELLPSRDSSVSSASVIWLNERAEDFALYGHLEKAFFRNHRKLDVSCIVERDLFGHQLASNANVQEAAPEFKIGPDFFVRKVTDYLVRRGYPEEVIITL